MTRAIQNSFSLGELSPRTYGRYDQPWYTMGCREVKNFITLPQGPAVVRPGTIRIQELSDGPHRVFCVVTKKGEEVLLVISSTGFTVYQIDSSGDYETAVVVLDYESNPLSETVDWSGIDLDDLQIVSYEGRFYFVHPSTPMRSYDISIDPPLISGEVFSASYLPYIESIKAGYKLNDIRSYLGKQYISLQDSPVDAPTEDEPHYTKVGSSIHLNGRGNILTYSGSTSYAYGDLCLYNDSLWIAGQAYYIEYDTFGTTHSELDEYAYYNGTVPIREIHVFIGVYHRFPQWEKCSRYLIKTNNRALNPNRPDDPSGLVWLKVMDLPGAGTLYDFVSTTAYTVGEYLFHGESIFLTVEDTTSPSPDPIEDTATVSDWRVIGDAPTFNSPGEYPNMILFHDRRLYILGTENSPNMIFASKTNEIDFFNMGVNDNDALQIALNQELNESISWGKSRKEIVLGGTKDELLLTGGDNPITPTSIQAYPQSKAGSMRNGALDIADIMVFFQPGGKRLLQFVFSNDTQSYQTPDMGQFGEHLLALGVKSFALQNNPDFILWCVMEDGTLLGGTYLPELKTFGWHHHDTDGTFESIEISSGSSEDIIWVTVQRPIRDSEGIITSYVRQLERFAPRLQALDKKMVFMDDAEILPVVDLEATVSSSKYNQTLTCTQGGAAHQDVTASAVGLISLQYDITGFDTCVVGRSFTARLQPQRQIPTGSKLDRGVRITRAAVRLLNSLGVELGATNGRIDPLVFRSTDDEIGQTVEPFTGEKSRTISHSPSGNEWLIIQRSLPMPVTVLGVTYDLEVGGA